MPIAVERQDFMILHKYIKHVNPAASSAEIMKDTWTIYEEVEAGNPPATEILESARSYERQLQATSSPSNLPQEPEPPKDTLLPCPHCGELKSLNLDKSESILEGRLPGFRVQCLKNKGGCGASSGYNETFKETIRIWNRRYYTPGTNSKNNNKSR